MGRKVGMLPRPRAGETERDLLASQERFLASGETAAASLAGGKRRQQSEELQEAGGRLQLQIASWTLCRSPSSQSTHHQEVKVQAAEAAWRHRMLPCVCVSL